MDCIPKAKLCWEVSRLIRVTETPGGCIYRFCAEKYGMCHFIIGDHTGWEFYDQRRTKDYLKV